MSCVSRLTLSAAIWAAIALRSEKKYWGDKSPDDICRREVSWLSLSYLPKSSTTPVIEPAKLAREKLAECGSRSDS